MLSFLRKRLSYTNVMVTAALFFAVSGGAFAAKRYLITSAKQIKPSVLKQLQGKNGSIGPAGAAGKEGPAGKNGADGTNGAPGANGKDGVSVTGAEVPKSSTTCNKQGGSEFTSASGKTTACNGKEGSPWTAGGALPSGATETGTWGAASQNVAIEAVSLVPISFPIALTPAAASATVAHLLAPGVEETAECPGTPAEPKATPGNLCIYTVVKNEVNEINIVNPVDFGELPATAGMQIDVRFNKAEGAVVDGTWAVTAK